MAAMTKRNEANKSNQSPRSDQMIDPLAFISPQSKNLASNSSLSSTTLSKTVTPSSSKPPIVPSSSSPSAVRFTPGFNPASSTSNTPGMMANRRMKPTMKLADLNPGNQLNSQKPKFLSVGTTASTPFSNFSKIVDPSGRLNFGGKAIVHSNGVDFSNGSSFSINMEELTLMEELGKGNYGTVQKVYHKPTKVVMAMKEIRLELDHSKLKAILTELDILHRASSNTIVEFYGAFFIESCVYYCMEFMDGGSLDKLAGADVPEPVLARVTTSVVEGLRFLKDELQTMHRDVKPTNILINRKGETKLCDFGVSGQLERSLAKTNIGCQSYMAPERIQGERTGEVKSYTVSSDVWSLGLSIVEFAIGHYPYPPETYSNIFAQLNEIVHGEAPRLPEDIYSPEAQDFVCKCLRKDAKERPSYNELLDHYFLRKFKEHQVDMVQWVQLALDQVKK
ncbi:kinase-like domain-containing protein [Phakopsora pachyrhizi]|uniref:mitogen-activated protein kinase kinase n=1 Tax=Phakopsora pachyrhizi TaxID=170000 RepID=A0AAV0AI34_PHAPC|nr:kinase-like domain-containing protein [Phakopsora pachyrhizi]